MPSKPYWSKSTGTLAIFDRQNSNNPKCAYRRLGCIGQLYFAEKKYHPNQVICDYCGAVWVNPLKHTLQELSEYKLSHTDEAWFYRLLATRKLVLPVRKPHLLERVYLTLKWYL